MVSTNTTTVDFNASGFSVVDNFVDHNVGISQNDNNGSYSKKNLTKTPSTSRSQLVPSKTSGRKGVGASDDQISNPRDGVSKTAIAKKILRVGAKKRRKGMNMDDDDEDDDDDAEMHADTPRDDDSDEESGSECGRTEITNDTDKQQLVKESGQPRVDATTKPKKKKKGRKERKIQEINQLPDGLTAKADQDASETSKGSAGKDANTSNSNDDDDDVGRQAKDQDADEVQEAKAKQQRARRKVRSRQKNVRKDTRLEKPPHLIPGQTRHYQGIPLTTETREKLHLPPPSSRTRKEASTAKIASQDDHDAFNAATSYAKDSISQQPLAVDYLMSDDNENGMSEAVIAPNTATMRGDRSSDVKTKKESKTKPSKKERQRPSKYKNLR